MTKTTDKQVDVLKISDLHLAKLQESNQKLDSISKQAAEIYQREFKLKQDKLVLDNYNGNTLAERQKLIEELSKAYGEVNINPHTGEYVVME
jgi:predicted MPP superfamily phosphohydrolase